MTRKRTLVIGSVARNSIEKWDEALVNLAPCYVTGSVTALSDGIDVEYIPGEGNIFLNRLDSHQIEAIAQVVVMPEYGETTLDEIESAVALNIPVRFWYYVGDDFQILPREN